MMKTSKTTLIVDSVEKAVKFYTEKLAFDITELESITEGNENILTYAQIKKGKCFIILRTPRVEELAEFSFIKRCASRCTGIYIEMKKGLERYFERCQKKGAQIVSELKDQPFGHKTFSIRDPFGIRLTFAQPIENFKPVIKDFCGLELSKIDQMRKEKSEKEVIEFLVKWLKEYGILRRSSKKYIKHWLKNYKKI